MIDASSGSRATRLDSFANPQHGLQTVTTVVLAAAVLLGPLWLGSTTTAGYCTLQVLVAVASLSFGMSRGHCHWIWLAWLFSALAVIQVVSLPAAILKSVSPFSHGIRLMATGDGAGSIALSSGDALESYRRGLMLVLTVALTAELSQNSRNRRLLFGAVASMGAIILILGLTFGPGADGRVLGVYEMRGVYKGYKNPELTGLHSSGVGYADETRVGEIRHFVHAPIVGSAVGAMINANHFAACVGITCLPVLCGLWGVLRSSRWTSPSALVLCGLYAATAVYAVAIPAQSRGATGALLLSLLVFGLLSIRKRWAHVTLLGLGILGTWFAIRLIQFPPAALTGRVSLWAAAMEMVELAPAFGVGLGNFSNALPCVPERVTTHTAYFAHGAWQEWAAEAGLAGLLLLSVVLVSMTRRCLQRSNVEASVTSRVLRGGAMGGLLFAGLYGVVDYSGQIPGNAYLTAVLLGIALAGTRTEDATTAQGAVRAEHPLRVRASWLTLLALGAYLAWGAVQEIRTEARAAPLQRALAVNQLRDASPAFRERQRQALLQALPHAEQSWEIRRDDHRLARDLGAAELILSEGRPGRRLNAARTWFETSLKLQPCNPWLRDTLSDMLKTRM